jgi:DNA-binding winged helix-turn-helix (wHTH) protein
MRILYEQSGEVVSRPEIIRVVWGKAAEGVTDQALDALVRRLRDRLAEIDPTWDYIVTVRGHGLRLDNPPFTQPA